MIHPFLPATLLAAAFAASACAASISSFDAPGAGASASQGTFPVCLNNRGDVVGYYVDSTGLNHAFVRTKSGAFTTLDPPGAASSFANSINRSGAIVGSYNDAAGVTHAFVRTPNGAFTSFDAPGAGTVATAINGPGAIAGFALFSGGGFRGFIRRLNGTLTLFEAPGTSAAHGFTFPLAINRRNTIAGYFLDASSVYHGFVRAADGTLTPFDPPGSTQTLAFSLDTGGDVVGRYTDGTQEIGYVRSASGSYTTVTAGSSVTIYSITDSSMIAGISVKRNTAYGLIKHASQKKPVLFSAPGSGTKHDRGSYVFSVNGFGILTGYSIDDNNVAHGFVRTP